MGWHHLAGNGCVGNEQEAGEGFPRRGLLYRSHHGVGAAAAPKRGQLLPSPLAIGLTELRLLMALGKKDKVAVWEACCHRRSRQRGREPRARAPGAEPVDRDRADRDSTPRGYRDADGGRQKSPEKASRRIGASRQTIRQGL